MRVVIVGYSATVSIGAAGKRDTASQIQTGEQAMITKDEIPAFCETYCVLVRADDFMYLLPHPALRDWVSTRRSLVFC